MVQFSAGRANRAHLHVAAVAARPTLSAEGASGRSYEKQFRGQTPLEVEAFFSTQQAELEFLTIFELTASVEAALRLDFDSRITNRGKDRISRKFRSHLNSSHVSLDADILEVWSTEANVKVGEFRGLFNLRYWLAHGRHWRPKIGQVYSAAGRRSNRNETAYCGTDRPRWALSTLERFQLEAPHNRPAVILKG